MKENWISGVGTLALVGFVGTAFIAHDFKAATYPARCVITYGYVGECGKVPKLDQEHTEVSSMSATAIVSYASNEFRVMYTSK